MQDIPISERIRLYRLSRGMTQEQLAGLADVSPSWLSKAERGVPLDRRLGPLSRVAGVLGVSVAELMGQRIPEPRSNGPDVRDGKGNMDALRRALLPGMDTPRPEEAVDLQRLVDDAAEARRLRQASRYSALGARLPDLIARGEQARRELTGRDRALACDALATIYSSGAGSLCSHVGEMELAVASMVLAMRVAKETGSRTLEGIVARRTALVLLRCGAENQALDLSMGAAQEMENVPRTASADEIAVHGSLLLESAFTAARTGDAPSAWRLLQEAERDAHRFGLERIHMATAFGHGNVLIYGLHVAVELGDFRGAVRRAELVDPSRLPAELQQRRAAYWIDVARAHASMRKPDDALDAVLRAEQVAPEEVRYQVEARDMVREFLRGKRQSVTPQLSGLAKRLSMSSN